MRSVTEQAALDEFLSTAELAGTDFTAEKMDNVKIIHKDQKNPYLLSAAEERATVKKHNAHRKHLTIPRRPPWDEHTTPRELEERERQSLLDWRRGLAELQESNDLLMTPFERNLEVWRQLWRVIERSDLVVQIVDARNPLLFRSEDLERYVKEVDSKKSNLLLVNKADMLTLEQRQAWADYFTQEGIEFRFFSAQLAKSINEARALKEDETQNSQSSAPERGTAGEEDKEQQETEATQEDKVRREDEVSVSDTELDSPITNGVHSSRDAEATRILTTEELEDLFAQYGHETDSEAEDEPRRKKNVGMVGYPNVGKSSTINALIGAKKVSVSSTPGKTKHFQTIHLSENVVLCDCPGLVFPNFATTKAELVCSGVLPIDQMREHTGPCALVAQRVPLRFLEAIYGIKIPIRPLEEGGTGVPTGEELLNAYAAARGFYTQGLGQPDESRAARTILKDYVKGKLLFCHPPPNDMSIDPRVFNSELYQETHLSNKRQAAPALAEGEASSPLHEALSIDESDAIPPAQQGEKTVKLDKKFFGPGQGSAGHLSTPFQFKSTEQITASGKQLSGRKQRTMIALERDIDPADLRAFGSKKHYKANKRKGKPTVEYG